MSAHSNSNEVRLSRTLGLLDITMIGIGAMIGAGIFVLTGIAAGEASSDPVMCGAAALTHEHR
jgi:amino acid transporter